MQSIYKYQLDFDVKQTVFGCFKKLLTVQIQNGKPCMWTIVDDKIQQTEISIYMVGTGTYDVEALNVSEKNTLKRRKSMEWCFTGFAINPVLCCSVLTRPDQNNWRNRVKLEVKGNRMNVIGDPHVLMNHPEGQSQQG